MKVIPADTLPIWTIYDHPADYPQHYVARLYLVMPGQLEPVATAHAIWSADLEQLRAYFEGSSGFYCVKRSQGDEACVVESWL